MPTTPLAGPVLDPGRLAENAFADFDDGWCHIMHSCQPCQGLCVNCINGRPGSQLNFRAESSPAFSLNILLEGRMQAAMDGGSIIQARAGSIILMATGQYASGWNVFDGVTDNAFRMVSIHFPKDALLELTGLDMDEVCRHLSAIDCDQTNSDTLLSVIPASRALQRLGMDILSLNRGYKNLCRIQTLLLRAKAFEAVASFFHENMVRREVVLPVPGDRSRLIEARALLEKAYGDDWKVASLARAVGLNENRLQTGFHAMFGLTVHACLIRIRIDAAVMMLRNGMSVTETATTVGFSHLSHFSRTFRKYIGISPKQCALGVQIQTQIDSNMFV